MQWSSWKSKFFFAICLFRFYFYRLLTKHFYVILSCITQSLHLPVHVTPKLAFITRSSWTLIFEWYKLISTIFWPCVGSTAGPPRVRNCGHYWPLMWKCTASQHAHLRWPRSFAQYHKIQNISRTTRAIRKRLLLPTNRKSYFMMASKGHLYDVVRSHLLGPYGFINQGHQKVQIWYDGWQHLTRLVVLRSKVKMPSKMCYR